MSLVRIVQALIENSKCLTSPPAVHPASSQRSIYRLIYLALFVWRYS